MELPVVDAVVHSDLTQLRGGSGVRTEGVQCTRSGGGCGERIQRQVHLRRVGSFTPLWIVCVLDSMRLGAWRT